MFIYVMWTRVACKVGKSRNPEKRRAAIQTGNPHAVRLAKVFEVPDEHARLIETKALGNLGMSFENQGEWLLGAPAKDCCAVVRYAIEAVTGKEPTESTDLPAWAA